MSPLSVDRFFEHNGQDTWRCTERDEDMTIKTHRRKNINEETCNLRVFKQGEYWTKPWGYGKGV